MKTQIARGRRIAAQTVSGAVMASLAFVGVALADTDNIQKNTQVNVPAIAINGAASGVAGCTPTSFSFDISWIDPFVHGYFLADRTHGSSATDGDVMVIDTSNPAGGAKFLSNTNDTMAGIRCDKNAAFGGTGAAGRNEITGPNGAFTVNHTEVWVGDGPGKFALPAAETNTAADYNNDQCDSSVRVFDLLSGAETDHINVGGCFRTDEGAFDPVDQVALFANPSEQPGIKNGKAPLNNTPYITLISTIPVAGGPITAPGATNRHRIIKQINFDGTHGTPLADGGIEQASYSFKTGLFYIAFPSTVEPPYNAGGGVAVVDPTGDADDIRVVKVFSTPGCSPNGSALGPDNELFLGCGNPPGNGPQQVIDIRNGHLIAKIAGTNGGCDEVAFNAGDDHFAGACTEGGATDNLDVSDADPVTGALDLQHNTGAAGAHSIAADPVKESSNSTASFWMPMFQGDCGAGIACVVVYASTGGDDPSEFVVEAAEDHHRDNR